MEKIVVPTKFNKTGKRILTVPLDDRRICAPAYKLLKKAIHIAQAEWECKTHSEIQAYMQKMAHWIASYVARDSTPATDKYRIAKFLAEQSLTERGPMNIAGPNSSQRWSIQLGGIGELSRVEEEAWEEYVTACHKVDAERKATLTKAHTDFNDMKRALSREVSDHIHRQYQQEDTQ